MQSENLLNINLAHAAEAAKRIDIELTDRFFADLEQEEISGGDVHAEILIRSSANNIYNVQIQVEGVVIVACDRCLDPLELKVKTKDTLKIKDAAPEDSDAAEMLYVEANTSVYDLSWNIYEIIETSLPIQRIHDEGECNKDMVSYIMTEDETSYYDNDEV